MPKIDIRANVTLNAQKFHSDKWLNDISDKIHRKIRYITQEVAKTCENWSINQCKNLTSEKLNYHYKVKINIFYDKNTNLTSLQELFM